MLTWLQHNETLLWWLGIGSTVTFFGTLLAIPLLLARIPEDYCVRSPTEQSPLRASNPALAILLRLLKNLAGVLFIVTGIAMLLLPGQGLLTILAGLFLIDFPGKRRFELALVRRKPVLRAINWIRRTSGHADLSISPKETS